MATNKVDRRGFLAGGAALTAAATLPGTARARRGGAQQRPNIVWFLSEDNNPRWLGAYGDPLARTPAIDRLAREGIRYETAYSAAPVCAPSRFALITGMYPASCGPAHHMRANGQLPAGVGGFPALLRAAGYYTTNNAKTDYNAPIDLAATWDESSARAHWRNRPEGAPFFAQFTSNATHESQLFGRTPLTTRPEDVVVPPYLPDTPEVREDRARNYDNHERMDAQLGARLAELEADGLLEDTIVVYFGDNGGVLPRSKRFANDDGLHVPLIVRIPEKWRHLAPGGPGTVVDAPVSCVDLPPTTLALAGLPVPSYMHGAPFLGRHARRRQYIFGQRSRMDERYDLQRTARDERYVYIRNYMPHRPYGQHVGYMFQQRGYQDWQRRHLDGELDLVQERFWDEKDAEELYDLERDPDQVRNLARSPRHRDELQRLRRALDAHLLEINDNGFIPEGSPLEGHDASRAPGAYPLRRVLRLAETAIERDPENLDELVAALDDGNEAIRYWAAQGILMLGPAAAPAVPALNAALAGDESTSVRIVAAEALARLGHPGRAVPFLAETLDTHANVRIRLQAINALTYVGVDALPHLDVVERAAASTDEYVGRAGRYLHAVLTGTYTPATAVG